MAISSVNNTTMVQTKPITKKPQPKEAGKSVPTSEAFSVELNSKKPVPPKAQPKK
ncbi:MAG: hypothetical protein H6Q67_2231 [Firmicutes bacterium]|nr:hypothetical protein [Bacillota bacterium]